MLHAVLIGIPEHQKQVPPSRNSMLRRLGITFNKPGIQLTQTCAGTDFRKIQNRSLVL